MTLESFIWCWVHLHPTHVAQTMLRFLLMASLILVPLVYLNIDMVRNGHRLTAPSFEIQVAPKTPGE